MHDAPARVGICPPHEHARRPRLWSALEDAYGVRFESREPGALAGLDGLVAIGGDGHERADRIGAEIPRLLADGEERPNAGASPGALEFSRDPALSRPLHGARLSEAHCTALARGDALERGDAREPSGAREPSDTRERSAMQEREIVLATLDGAPVWTRASGEWSQTQRVACAPAELGEGEALRERLEPGRCLALLALARFLGDLTATPAAPLRATFLIDDPNLHWRSYGHLRYPELLRDARAHGYHLSVAMVPLDGWFAQPRVARLFREGAARLSVCVHGNEHYGPELGRPRTVAEGIALGRRALARVERFERRTGVAVDRVMVPPHERIGEPMARALVACGFRALCTTRPYPWAVNSPDLPWLTRPDDAGPLAAWRAVDVVAGGLPVLLRADFALHPREDLVLRAFLGQPLILYGHHELLSEGPEVLAQAAAEIGALGDVRWCSLAEIARASVAAGASADAAGSDTPTSATELDATTVPLQPRRLRPVLRRVAAESEVRMRAALAGRGKRA